MMDMGYHNILNKQANYLTNPTKYAILNKKNKNLNYHINVIKSEIRYNLDCVG
jgi:hypothetical protein